MMNKLLTILFLLLVSKVVSASNGERELGNDTAKTYLDYFRSAALADEAVVNGNYRDAVRRYNKVFDEFPFNNPIDCYVAAQVASYTGDTNSCIDFMYRGLSFGLPEQTINNNPHLSGIIAKTDKRIIDSCWNINLQRIDGEARAAIISLAKQDRAFIHNLERSDGGLYKADGYTLKDGYRPFYDSLITAIVHLTHTHGFPAQKIAGTQTGEYSLFKVSPNAVFALYIFIHHDSCWNKVGTLLWSELLKGNITPQMFGAIYESTNGNALYEGPVNYFAVRPCQEWKCKRMVTKNHLKEIDGQRWAIGLGSYSTMKKKFKSCADYKRWLKDDTNKQKPFFDFECYLGFQGI